MGNWALPINSWPSSAKTKLTNTVNWLNNGGSAPFRPSLMLFLTAAPVMHLHLGKHADARRQPPTKMSPTAVVWLLLYSNGTEEGSRRDDEEDWQALSSLANENLTVRNNLAASYASLTAPNELDQQVMQGLVDQAAVSAQNRGLVAQLATVVKMTPPNKPIC